MKRIAKILGVMLLVIALIMVGGFLYIKNIDIPAISVGEVSLGDIADGSYKGEYSAGPVSAAVTVAIKDKKIIDIIIDKHENGMGQKAEKIINDIIGAQSINIDVVSGATLSSNVIRKAVEQALTK